MREYALYKGDDCIAIGTIKDIAEKRGVKPDTIQYYRHPAYQKRTDRWKKPTGRLILIPLIDDDDDNE